MFTMRATKDIGSLPSIPNTTNFASLPVTSCQVCYMGANLRCKKCKSAYYCSAQHAKDDHRRHKRECAILAAGLNSQEGHPLSVKAVLFPMDGGQPRIVDVAYKLVYRPETPNIPYHHPDLRPFIGNATPSPTTIQTDGFLTGKPLGYSLTLVYNDNFVAENKPVNLCVESLRDRPGYMWRDNVLGFRNTEPADRTAQFDDATEDDVRVFTKYLTQGGDGRDAVDDETQRIFNRLVKQSGGVQALLMFSPTSMHHYLTYGYPRTPP